ncbi:MAG: 50S ribosomal protein L24 [Actinomycetota bacterium]
MSASKIRKNDIVQVISGKDRGKQGRVVRVYPARNAVMVEGVNQVKRHERVRPAQGRSGVTGGIITKEMPVDVSNVALLCSSCSAPTRVGFDVSAEGKQRVCKKCGARI